MEAASKKEAGGDAKLTLNMFFFFYFALPDASFGQAVFRQWLPGLTCQILRLKEKLDINIPKQQFKKQMQIVNIDVWTHPSQNFSTFGRSKS